MQGNDMEGIEPQGKEKKLQINPKLCRVNFKFQISIIK
jgi:hypothetical protein